MPWFSVEVTKWTNAVVQADTEEQAIKKACGASLDASDFDNTEAQCFGRADEDCEDEDDIRAMKSGFDVVIA